MRPAAASPLTYFVAPSMLPKKLASFCNFSRRAFASSSVMAPVFKSASMAICLPGIASKVNRAVTSATRSEPLLITTNCTINKMMKIMAPTIKSPPPTKEPKVVTTLPGLPVVRIKRVEDTFKEIRKIVVNNRMVGKFDISRISCVYKHRIIITKAIEMLNANIISNIKEGIGTIKNTIAAKIYAATPMSVVLTPLVTSTVFLLPKIYKNTKCMIQNEKYTRYTTYYYK